MLTLLKYMLWIIGAVAIGYVYYLLLAFIVSMVTPNEMFPGFMKYKVLYWLVLSIFAYPQAKKLLS